jgi:hypothetical protein
MSISLNNGIFLRDTEYRPMGAHVDRAHLRNISPMKPTDLGIIDLWAMAQKKEAPLYTMSSFGGKNTIYSKSHKFTWKIPTQGVMPYVVESYIPADTERVGEDEETFKVKFNKRFVGLGAVITYDKFNGVEFQTVGEIVDGDDGVIYTLKIISFHKYVDKKFLEPGTYYHRKTSVRTEHSVDWDEQLLGEGGYREFFNYVGEYQVHDSYSISEDAAEMPINKEIVELWKVGENVDPSLKSVRSVSELANTVGKSKMKQMYENGDLSYTWTKKRDQLSMNKLLLDVENYLMWGQGGTSRNVSGPNDVRLPAGLWRQLDNGFKRVYTRDEFSYEMFRSEIYNYFHGKIDFKGPDSLMKLQVQTGMAGMQLINKMIMREITTAGFQLNASDMGVLSGDRMGLEWGIFADKIKMPFLANLEFVYNPAFDTNDNNPIENPIVDGYPLSSYSFVIFDYNTEKGSDNIKLMKYSPTGNPSSSSDMKMIIQDGTASYFGGKQVRSTGDFSGYRVKFTMRTPTIFVEDPTKILRFSLKNPVTGFSL